MRSRVSACWSLIRDVRKTKTKGSTKNRAVAIPRECTAIQCSAALRRARLGGAHHGRSNADAVVMDQSPEPIRPPRLRISSAVQAMERANRTSATTHAAP